MQKDFHRELIQLEGELFALSSLSSCSRNADMVAEFQQSILRLAEKKERRNVGAR